MNSMRLHLTRTLLVTIGLLLGSAVTALYFSARDAATDLFDASLSTKARAVLALASRADEKAMADMLVPFIDGRTAKGRRDRVQIWDAEGRELLPNDSARMAWAKPPKDGTREQPTIWNLTLPDGRPGRAISWKIEADATSEGPAGRRGWRLILAADREELDEALSQVVIIGGGMALLLGFATPLIISRELKRGLRPVELLGRQTQQITAESLSTRFKVDHLPQELQPIAVRLNDLLDRLESSFERERRFSADLAHELRTPVAELRTLAECAIRWPDARESEMDHDMLAIARRMESLVTQLLNLARSEVDRLNPELSPVAVHSVVQALCARFEPKARDRGLTLEVMTQDCTAPANQTALESILNNLLENALDHSDPGGTVRLELKNQGAFASLEISNPAASLAPQEIPLMFERFWRKDASRTGISHLGLGLPLARTLAAAMQWQLEAELRDPGRVTFTLAGPLDRDRIQ